MTGHGIKTHRRQEAPRSEHSSMGHISKGMWVAQAIAGGELCVLSKDYEKETKSFH